MAENFRYGSRGVTFALASHLGTEQKPRQLRRTRSLDQIKTGARFFTAAQHTLVEELSETIIPADSHSGGAKAAKVADYIEQVLRETTDDNQKAGLA